MPTLRDLNQACNGVPKAKNECHSIYKLKAVSEMKAKKQITMEGIQICVNNEVLFHAIAA